MELKSWIRAARKHKGLTQTQFGDLFARTKANISGWEKGIHEPSWDQIKSISEKTGYPLAALVDGFSIPLSPEVQARLSQLKADELRRAENSIRQHFDMDPLPRSANEMAA